MKRQIRYLVMLLAGGIVLGLLLTPITSSAAVQGGERRTIPAGEKEKIDGVVVTRDGETMVVRDKQRRDTVVLLTDDTSVKTNRKGAFRGGKSYGMTSIVPGLILSVDGKGDSEGRLVADDIRFREDDVRAAITAHTAVNPVAQQAAANKQNIETNKQNIETNKQNIDANKQSISDTNQRISDLDEWELVKTVSVYFAVGKSDLSPEARATLDEIGPRANVVKNYKVEIQGFADSTGNAQKNLDLSQQRADNVVQYLSVKYQVPLRRISTPMGYGATQATGVDSTEKNKDRRVDIRILTNKAVR